jgi:uncharacterized protein (DUF58 family)
MPISGSKTSSSEANLKLANSGTDLLSPQDRARVASLQLFARSVVDGITVGKHQSPHKGFSAEFKEHRPYVLGDEIRSIDWKLYGKTDRLFIRQYEEETNLRCTILVDQSKSMAYGGGPKDGGLKVSIKLSKHEYAIRMAAAIAYFLISQQDAVGLGLIDTELRSYIPPRGRPNHLQVLMQTLANSQCDGETSLGSVIQQAAPRLRGRGVVVLISDCFDDLPTLIKALSFFRLANNEVILFQIFDRDELDFPFRKRTEFRNLEATDQRKMIDPATLRKAYLEKVAAFRKTLADGCSKNRIDLVPCVTDMPHSEVLASYLASRGGLR